MTEDDVAKRIALAIEDYILGEYIEHLETRTLPQHAARMARIAIDRMKESHELVARMPGQLAMDLRSTAARTRPR